MTANFFFTVLKNSGFEQCREMGRAKKLVWFQFRGAKGGLDE